MRILVTGVSGFVGAHLVRELTEAGHRVWGTDREGSAIDGLEGRVAIRADLTHRADVSRAVSTARPDAIIHLAAQSSPADSWHEPAETITSNTGGTANIVMEAARENPGAIFLFASSSDVYGKSEGAPVEFSEESPLRPTTPYAVSKLAAEQVATLLGNRAGIRMIVARPFSHTGPGQTERFVVPAFSRQIALIECGEETQLHHGDLDPCRDFTDVRDVVRAYRLLIDSPDASGVFNVCSGRAVSIQTILDHLVSMARCPIDCKPDPKRVRGEGPNPVHGSAQRLFRKTGWEPRIPLEQTLADVLAEQRGSVAQRENSCAESS